MKIEFGASGGIVGIFYLILLLWALYHIVQSHRGFLNKLVWILVVIFFPILGAIALLLFGPRAGR
ncbi:hypothetical protein STVA_09780 [Allostella vacuolata]|nr:hypothetical protein STVA_09780 [Stella vacuolata]